MRLQRRVGSIIAAIFLVIHYATGHAMAAATSDAPNSLFQLIGQAYDSALQIVGLCVFVMLLWAGLQMILPNGGGWKAAQSIIIDAAIGLILLFSAYVILSTINPDLVKESRGIPVLQGQ